MKKNSSFWKNVPTGKKTTSLEKEPPKIPENYKITIFKMERDLNDVTKLIKENYKDKCDANIYLEYSYEFMKWYLEDCTIGIMLYFQEELIGFISGNEILFKCKNGKNVFLAVNFLVLKLGHRNLTLAPLLISHLTSIANNIGIYSAIFTGGKSFCFEFVKINYFHRPINIKKLQEARYLYYYEEKETNSNVKLRLANENDIEQLNILYDKESNKFLFSEITTQRNMKKMFMPIKDVLVTYVKEESSSIVGYITYFFVNTRLTYSDVSIKCAYVYHWSSDEIRSLLDSSFLLLKEDNVDVVNCLGLGSNLLFCCDNDFWVW
jgi:glycylpeptide N-tetradecanoyltransferase